MRLQRAEVALIDAAPAMQDQDAVGVGVLQGLRPGELSAVQIRECERVD